MYHIIPIFIRKCLKAFSSQILWHMSQHLFLNFWGIWAFRKRRNFKCHIFLFWKMNCRYDVVHIFNFFWYKSDTFIFLLLIFTERVTTTHVHSSHTFILNVHDYKIIEAKDAILHIFSSVWYFFIFLVIKRWIYIYMTCL